MQVESGYYFYINSSRVGVKNCSYNVSKHNDLLPPGTYNFNANGQMTNPPATASVYGVERATALATIVEDYDYVYIGSQLVQMSISTSRNGGTATEEVLNFAYDASGMPATVSYNDVIYYYITNLQGDVLAIVDGHGATLVEYEYDPYGRLRSMTGVMSNTLGEANPLRYRGYVYDTESTLYYLQSRYYDPKLGRFINADAYASTGQGVLGNNMFAYCGNNPISRIDTKGTFFFTVIGAVIGAVVGAVDAWMMGGDTEEIIKGAEAGAWSGGIAGAGVDVGVLIVASGGSMGVALGIAAGTGALGGVVGTGISTDWQAEPTEYVGAALLGAGLNMVSFGTAPINGQIMKGTVPQMIDGIIQVSGAKCTDLFENAMYGTIIAEASVWIYRVMSGKRDSNQERSVTPYE